MEANALLDEILLLAAVASTIEGHRYRDLWQLHELRHCQLHGFVNKTRDLDRMGIPEELGADTVVANVVERCRSEELVLSEDRQWCFTVEWVDACKAIQALISRYPLVSVVRIPKRRGNALVWHKANLV